LVSSMGTIDLEYSDRAAGELLGQLERGQGGSGRFGSSTDGQTVSAYAQALSEANAKRLLAAAEELEG